MKSNTIVLFGKPGAGKGTRLSEFLEGREEQYETLSVGNLLRKARREETELGKIAQFYMDAGIFVPDKIIIDIVMESIKETTKTIITDGFPRTVGQAEAMLAAGMYPSKVIEVFLDDDIVIERARDRIICNDCSEPYTLNPYKRPKVAYICDKCGGPLLRRPDDDETTVQKRLEVYRNETYPVLEILKKANVAIYTVDNSQADVSEKFTQLLLD